MYIDWIEIERLPPLKGDVLFKCDRRVNLFIGPNASGKSTILRALNEMQLIQLDWAEIDGDLCIYETSDISSESTLTPSVAFGASFAGYPNDNGSVPTIWEEVPFLFVPATRLNLTTMDVPDHAVEGTLPEEDPDGLVQELKWEFNDLLESKSGVFNGQSVQEAIHRLSSISSLFPRFRLELRSALEAGYACAKQICSDVIIDDIPHFYVESDGGRRATAEHRSEHYGMGIGTIDDPLGVPLYAGTLSSGTQGTLLWIYALSLKMASHYLWEKGWQENPAILLIDEIDNHLHPTWQRRVIPALLKHFPGLQIFATSHSPFVVAGLKAGQVQLLKRDDDGMVAAAANPEDVIGWTSDEILRNMMDVDDPTDDETALAAEELRGLRNSPRGENDAKEQVRQERMQELRQKVNRELLAGGPKAAQRELFEEQFTKALEKYRQSQNLNQDSG